MAHPDALHVVKHTDARRVLASALILVAGIGIALIVVGMVINSDNDINFPYELTKTGLQLLVVTVLGTIVAFAVNRVEQTRAERQQREELGLRILHEILTCYNQVKSVRRNLRALGLRHPTSSLDEVQAAGLRTQMMALNEAQLSFESLKREMEQTRPFEGTDEIMQVLLQVEQYLNEGVREHGTRRPTDPRRGGVLGEWQARTGRLAVGAPAATLNDLRYLQAFLGKQSESFEKYLSSPMDRIIKDVRNELFPQHGLRMPDGQR